MITLCKDCIEKCNDCKARIGTLALEIYSVFTEARVEANEKYQEQTSSELSDIFLADLQRKALEVFNLPFNR